jgi:hypothetical protein
VAGKVPNDIRDQLVSLFREKVCEKMNITPFLHQRTVWAASEGLELTGIEDPNGQSVKDHSGAIVHIGTRPRVNGVARFLADLGAFKIGKSFGAALWASGFGAVPDARVSLVGLEYSICEPEFNYLCDFLLSEAGMGLKARTLTNRPRQGDMFLELMNGSRFEAKSWERKDSLKGKEIDAYIYCEAYQLPGMECFTSFSQNLRARKGFAYFATTPDRPWIKLLHEMGHGHDPEWHCTCSVGAEVNPYTFDQRAKERDKNLMTKEKYEIHYNGQLGDFVGRVYPYSRGERVFTPGSHPALFRDSSGSRESLIVPSGWEIVGGADTGTYYSAVLVAFSPEGDAFVLDEFPNYRYVAGEAERDESITIPGWARTVSRRALALGGRGALWADPNSQFKGELRNYGIILLPARQPVEARSEIAREYFQHGRIWFAPWVTELPYEVENAAWPEEVSMSGKFARVKHNDHLLDPLEHVLARRPLGRVPASARPKGSFLASVYGSNRKRRGNVAMGGA